MADTMKSLVCRGPEKIGFEDVPAPKIIEPDDAIVRVILPPSVNRLSEQQAEPKRQSHLPMTWGHLNSFTPCKDPSTPSGNRQSRQGFHPN